MPSIEPCPLLFAPPDLGFAQLKNRVLMGSMRWGGNTVLRRRSRGAAEILVDRRVDEAGGSNRRACGLPGAPRRTPRGGR